MKYAWMCTQRKVFPLPAMCDALTVSVSGYRAWKRGGSPTRKRLTDAQLLAFIQAIDSDIINNDISPVRRIDPANQIEKGTFTGTALAQ